MHYQTFGHVDILFNSTTLRCNYIPLPLDSMKINGHKNYPKISRQKPSDTTIHWKALEENFLWCHLMIDSLEGVKISEVLQFTEDSFYDLRFRVCSANVSYRLFVKA
jgi:hypothetical protein